MRLLENYEFPILQSGEKIYVFRSLHVRACRTLKAEGARAPSLFLKKYVKEKKKERETEKMSDLPMSQMRYQNMLIWAVMKCLKPLSFRGLCPLDPNQGP